MTRRGVSENGLAFIKAHEGFRARAVKLADGRWLIGHSGVEEDIEGAEISLEEADERLRRDLEPIEDAVNELVFAPLTQGQLDALVSLGFSIGLAAFRACGVAEALNDGRPIDAAAVFDRARQAEVGGAVKTVDALVRRRAAEKAMFLELESGPVAAPSALLRPVIDAGRRAAAPVVPGASRETMAGAPDPAMIERIARILPEAPAASDSGEIAVSVGAPATGPEELRITTLAEARGRPRGSSPFPSAPYPLRKGITSPGRAAVKPSGAPWAARGWRGGVIGALPGAPSEWSAQWPWILGGGGLALVAVGLANVGPALAADSSSAGVGWIVAAIAGLLAVGAGGYHGARRVLRTEDARGPIP